MSSHVTRQRVTPATLFHRTAMPAVLFAGVLVSILTGVQVLVLPALLSVEIAGEVHNVQDLKAYADALQDQLEKKQGRRNALILPMEGSSYQRLSDWKKEQYDLSLLLSSLSQVAKSFTGLQGEPAVIVSSVRYYPIDRVLKVEGDVQHVGPRSMTVLAQFLDAVQGHAFVQSVKHPTFTRIEDENHEFHSPFTLTIALQ